MLMRCCTVLQVDLTWHGHDHIYERTCPVYKSICQQPNADGSLSAPIHVVIGNAGYELSWFANPDVPPYWVRHVDLHACRPWWSSAPLPILHRCMNELEP